MDGADRLKVRQFFRGLTGLVFPPSCLLCGRQSNLAMSVAMLCRVCLRGLDPQADHCCIRCSSYTEWKALGLNGCENCLPGANHIDQTWALGGYVGTARAVVLKMKQRDKEPLAMSMGRVLARKLSKTKFLDDVDLVTHIPIHWSRRASRGHNVSELLVEPVARLHGLASTINLLKYVRKTKKQGTLGPRERFDNVRGAMRMSRRRSVRGARILIVDDVMTTGATVGEAARVCLDAGAACVKVAIIARARGIGIKGSSSIGKQLMEMQRR